MELERKEIGYWCKPSPCHGDILIKLFKERQSTIMCSSKSDNLEFSPVLTQHGRSGKNDDICCNVTPSGFSPLRLNGGGDIVTYLMSTKILHLKEITIFRLMRYRLMVC